MLARGSGKLAGGSEKLAGGSGRPVRGSGGQWWSERPASWGKDVEETSENGS